MSALSLPEVSRRPLPAELLAALQTRFGAQFVTSHAQRLAHGRDESAYPDTLPDGVVYATTGKEVVDLVKLCADFAYPLVAWGAGTSLEGHLLPIAGGITLDLSQLNQILAIHPEDMTATVQAGVTREALNAALAHTGLFFPIDPGANATLGGMASTRASGTNAVRYGTMRDNVVNVTAVLANGEVVQTGQRARKSSAGYDLTRLLVGAEGTLGIITELTVKLYPQPEAISAAVVRFPSVSAAIATVIQTIQLGVPVARCELLDQLTIEAVNAHSQTTLEPAPTLFLEFHGSPAGVAEQVAQVQAVAQEAGGADFQWATRPEDRSKLWKARHHAYFACLQLRPGARAITTDVCVPISRLGECIEATLADVGPSGLMAPILGHVGDGNFHMLMLVDPAQPAEYSLAEAISARLVERALALEGTCTGEHGVGLHKMPYLEAEVGSAGLAAMRAIKHALDPKNILNPGKIVSWA
ncbi:FAD-binding oxidoreductase [Parvibium lacunae]|uniref:D-lactate dehydrogenase (cytochrome) n=1 Tax=Parvibium lacunae TaxID=1888893 RepID=A0A368KZM1_9BURK|nr:FAD-linked oxidase C-terminal domain-containing protein [Parvibium lacunae]RCS56758.1 FAD-binding protein [Parvibium lacunae]